jgi:hypothetical protein
MVFILTKRLFDIFSVMIDTDPEMINYSEKKKTLSVLISMYRVDTILSSRV